METGVGGVVGAPVGKEDIPPTIASSDIDRVLMGTPSEPMVEVVPAGERKDVGIFEGRLVLVGTLTFIGIFCSCFGVRTCSLYA